MKKIVSPTNPHGIFYAYFFLCDLRFVGLVIVVVVLGGGRGLFVMSCRVVLGEDSSEDGG